jgi:hypothetical protein
MKRLRSEQGLTLIEVLIMAAASLAMMASLAHILTQGTQISGFQKRYKTAIEGAQAALSVNKEFIGLRGDTTQMPALTNFAVTSGTCMSEKLSTATSGWSTSCDDSSVIDPSDPTTYDMHFDLGRYRQYIKIVYAEQGNSGADTGLIKTGVVNNDDAIAVTPIPFNYSVEILSQDLTSPQERAKFSVLYQY